MKILKGQRWRWQGYCLVETLEDSQDFDPNRRAVLVNCRELTDSDYPRKVDNWYFGEGFDKFWEYLEGQDAPK